MDYVRFLFYQPLQSLHHYEACNVSHQESQEMYLAQTDAVAPTGAVAPTSAVAATALSLVSGMPYFSLFGRKDSLRSQCIISADNIFASWVEK